MQILKVFSDILNSDEMLLKLCFPSDDTVYFVQREKELFFLPLNHNHLNKPNRLLLTATSLASECIRTCWFHVML